MILLIPIAGGNSTPSYSYEPTVYWVSEKQQHSHLAELYLLIEPQEQQL